MLFALGKERGNMQLIKTIKSLTKFECVLWAASVAVVSASFLCSGKPDFLTLAASLVGVSALIFVSKGAVLGQLLTVSFSLLYGWISFGFHYYGEMATYLGMTAPIAMMSVISWLRHPYQQSAEVEVHQLTVRQKALLPILTSLVTWLFYYILRFWGTANLFWSTVSIATSFSASYLMLMRNPWYALAYGANDVVLIVLWVLAAVSDRSSLPMVFCFLMFLANDLYGYWNWRRMKRRQQKASGYPPGE